MADVITWSLATTNQAPAESHFDIGATADDSNIESVLEPDLRKRVAAADIAPGGKYRSIVKLQIRYEKQAPSDPRYAQGTGWLIAPDLLVTAGHCAYDHTYRFGKASQVKAYIGYNGVASIGTSSVQFRSGSRIATTKEWVLSDVNRAYDVSFIQLDKAFDGVKPFLYQPTPTIDTRVIGVIGYPTDMTLHDEHGAQMYEMFKEVSFDLGHSTLNMLEYDISCFAGQSGSPVLLQGQNQAIGVHVYGLGNKNSASVIRGSYGNFFKTYVDSFRTSLSTLPDFQGMKTVQVPVATEDSLEEAPVSDIEDFWNMFRVIKGTTENVDSVILSTGSPFLGPLAGPISVAAGTAIGIAGKLVNNPGSDLEPGLDYKAYASRAILSEAALQTVLRMDSQQWSKYGLAQRLSKAFKADKFTVGPLSKKLAPAVMDAAIRIAVAQTAPNATATASTYPNIPVPVTTESTMDPQVGAFASGLQAAASDDAHEADFLDFLGSVVKAAVKVVPVAINTISNSLGKAESSFGPGARPNHDSIEDHVQIVCQRSLFGEAALQGLMTIPAQDMHEEGFFGDLIDVVKSAASTGIRVAPSIMKTVAPLIMSTVAANSNRPDQATDSKPPPATGSPGSKPRKSMLDLLNDMNSVNL